MITISTAQWAALIIMLLLVYVISVPIIGFVQAWIADLMGDPTAKEEGYLSLNPLVQIDPLGLIFLVIFRLGWLRPLPVNPNNVLGRFKLARLGIIYSTETVASLAICLIALACCVIFFGQITTIKIIRAMFSKEMAPLKLAGILLPQYSSTGVMTSVLLVAFVYINIFIAVFGLIFNGIRYFLAVGFEKGYDYIEHADIISLLGPLVLIYLLGDMLIPFLLNTVMWTACKIAFLLGMFHL